MDKMKHRAKYFKNIPRKVACNTRLWLGKSPTPEQLTPSPDSSKQQIIMTTGRLLLFVHYYYKGNRQRTHQETRKRITIPTTQRSSTQTPGKYYNYGSGKRTATTIFFTFLFEHFHYSLFSYIDLNG